MTSTVGALHLPGVIQPAIVDEASNDARWRAWQLKGREDEARFRRRLRTVLIDAAAVAALAGAVWFGFQI